MSKTKEWVLQEINPQHQTEESKNPTDKKYLGYDYDENWRDLLFWLVGAACYLALLITKEQDKFGREDVEIDNAFKSNEKVLMLYLSSVLLAVKKNSFAD